MLVVNLFQPGGVTVSIDVPDEIVAGTEFKVSVTVDKGSLSGFSRFQMDIPAGLKASSYQSSNADFTFSENRVRMIWLRLPSADEMTFVFKVNVDERLKGTFSLDGQFSFIMDNERKSVSSSSHPITILSSPTIDPALIVDISEFEEKVIQHIRAASEATENIACLRQAPFANQSGTEYIVNILVRKEELKKFAKIEETIPENYTAVAIETRDGIFTLRNQVVKFLWNILPAEPEFVVSYRLIPKNGAAMTKPSINGTFSFMVDDKTLGVDIVEVERDVEKLSEDEIDQVIRELRNQPIKIPEVKPEENQETKPAGVMEPITAARPEKKIQVTKTSKKTFGDLAYLLEPEQGVYYRVQLAAGHKPVDIKRYFRKFNLDMEVRKESHEGWIKYSVGSFRVYKEARDYRVHIWNTTQISDAFVSAYNNGNRITVQEALMIADQKWYK